MPIRMVDDPQDNNKNNQQYDDYDYNQRDQAGSGGGLGSMIGFLPILFGLFRGAGKKVIWLIILGGLGYLGYKIYQNFSAQQSSAQVNTTNDFSKTGYKYDSLQYKKESVYEPLADNKQYNALPDQVSLLRMAPQRLDQGEQGSCVAWSSAYAAQSILFNSSANANIAFSPAFMYNNIGFENCQGSYLPNAMKFLQQYGGVPYANFPYNPNSCSRMPSQNDLTIAQQFKIHGYQRLTENYDQTIVNINAIKQHLAKDAPVCIGMMVGESFMTPMRGKKLWIPTQRDKQMYGLGGHAMCVIGYDDNLAGGAFQIMNSWGPQWGENGIAWVRYNDFKYFVREAYGIDPLPKKGAALNRSFDVAVGLVRNDNQQIIPLKSVAGNVFGSTGLVPKNTTFKISVRNNVECYIYLFGEETTGKSYVLFPYKQGHSPYFGITGYRTFPRNTSLKVDELGTKDKFAIVASKQPLQYDNFNAKINAATGSFEQKLAAAIGSFNATGTVYKAQPNGSIVFSAGATTNDKMVGMVVEINK